MPVWRRPLEYADSGVIIERSLKLYPSGYWHVQVDEYILVPANSQHQIIDRGLVLEEGAVIELEEGADLIIV